MRKASMLRIWDVITAGWHHNAGNGIHPSAAFRAIIEREQSRACRNHHGFTVTVFGFPSTDGSKGAIERLPGFLKEHVRYTDEVGWINDREIGVLLPETSTDGAACFAEHIREAMGPTEPLPSYRILVFPEEDDNRNGGGPEQLRIKSIVPNQETTPFSRPLPLAEKRDSGRVSNATVGGGHPVPGQGEELESLLAARFPLWKRGFDVALALVCLGLLAPLMLLIAAVIKIVSRGPVLFRQTRIGYMGRTFECLKLRTMHVANDAASHRQHLSTLIKSGAPMTKLDAKDDSRIIPMGRLLRASGLDELPQLINVLRGEMSMIGPRPCIPYEYEEYKRWHKCRVHAQPGLTGLWQVSGKNRTTFTEMIRLDIAYHRKQCLWMDIRILLRTLPAVLAQMRDISSAKAGVRRVA